MIYEIRYENETRIHAVTPKDAMAMFAVMFPSATVKAIVPHDPYEGATRRQVQDNFLVRPRNSGILALYSVWNVRDEKWHARSGQSLATAVRQRDHIVDGICKKRRIA